MEDKYSFDCHKVNLSNIASFSKEMSLVEEQRICEIAEIARSSVIFSKDLLDDGMSWSDVLCILGSSLLLDGINSNESSLNENLRRLDKFNETALSLDKSVFCALFLEYCDEFGLSVTEGRFLGKKPLSERFVYVKNLYSDEAYDVFSQDFLNPTLTYASSFKDALRMIFDNNATYCLLPIEERGARIPSVDELIFRGDYKINAVIPVFGFDGSADLKYAMVSKNLYPTASESDDDKYFEFKIPVDSDLNISEVMLCAEELGCSVYRINTQCFDTEEGKKAYFSVVLKDTGEDFSKLFIYLTLFAPEHIPVGIYKNLE